MVVAEKTKIIKDNGFVEPKQLTDLPQLLPSGATEFSISMGRKGMVWVLRIDETSFLILASRHQITAAIHAALKELESPHSSPPPTEEPVTGAKEEESIDRIRRRFQKKNNLGKFFSDSESFSHSPTEFRSDFVWVRKVGRKRYLALCDTHIEGSFGTLVAMHLDTILDEYALDESLPFPEVIDNINSQLNDYNLDYLSQDDADKKIDIALCICVINDNQITIKQKGVGVIVKDKEESTFFELPSETPGVQTINLNTGTSLILFSKGLTQAFAESELETTLRANTTLKDIGDQIAKQDTQTNISLLRITI